MTARRAMWCTATATGRSSWIWTTPASWPISTTPRLTARLPEPTYENPPAHHLPAAGRAGGGAAGGGLRRALSERRQVCCAPAQFAVAGVGPRGGIPPGREVQSL